MIKQNIIDALNNQVEAEAGASQLYLAMASWADSRGLEGISEFLFAHSDEERMHMLKLIRFINERGGKAIIPSLHMPKQDFQNLNEIFTMLLDHEVKVSEMINEIVDLTLSEKDYTTHNFLQWYVSEQIEEERLARIILDKLKLIGDDKGGMYLFDRDISTFNPAK
ncbi:ferritin [Moheibacter sediminis]|uniref:Ferritin n=1 Tax=Moheibacter sediminis TaxID=1434700 RepID=A0A1W2AFZ9_9FLAO|nr:ferritin [Moheibacter sediminis]SMC59168.1 ferritin [Moheibacter sediminis]